MNLFKTVDKLFGKIADVVDDNKYDEVKVFDTSNLNIATWKPKEEMGLFTTQQDVTVPYVFYSYYDDLKMQFALYSIREQKGIITGVEQAKNKVFTPHVRQAIDKIILKMYELEPTHFSVLDNKLAVIKQADTFCKALGFEYHVPQD